VAQFDVRVVVSLKPGVLDPQGDAIEKSLRGVGFDGVMGVRSGKVFDVKIAAAGPDEALEAARAMASRVLANPVLEVFTVEGAPL